MQKYLQVLLGFMLCYTGILHLTKRREEFQAQVPYWLGIDADLVVVASGAIEILLGIALVTLWRIRKQVGVVTALFFVVVFPGNIWQYIDGIDAFGLNSDRDRALRLLFQPILILWALFATQTIGKKS
ncbi:MAG: hypothetical protein FJW49_02770 [Actinobacteria bacterium]|nr:hypothetical protein [Actinomycetota bacterium]